MEFVEQCCDLAVNVLGAVIGVEAVNDEGESRDEGLEHGCPASMRPDKMIDAGQGTEDPAGTS
ncbi:MAG: hypothetical protein ABFS02_02295 [Pseudomonadota bacterium]